MPTSVPPPFLHRCWRWLTARTLARRVALALLAALVTVWAMLIVLRFTEIRSDENNATGLGIYGTTLLDVLATVQDPAEARAALRTAEHVGSAFMVREGVPGMLTQLWDQTTQRQVHASAAVEAIPLKGDAQGHTLQVVDGITYHVFEGMTGRWSLRLGMPVLPSSWLVRTIGGDLVRYVLAAMPVLLLPVGLAVSQGLRPLRKLAAHIAARNADDLSPIGLQVRHAELKPLVTALDSLLAQLRSKVRREHTFVEDAAHELRTPMAVISAQAHALAKAADPAARREAQQQLDHAIARTSHLVQQLLVLARVDRDAPTLSVGDTDLAQLVRAELARLSPVALARRIELSLEAPDTLSHALDVHAFQSVLSNLLDNALRYGREGGHVAIELQPEGAGGLVLSVADDGPGIPAAERPSVFERFYRGAGHDLPGSGLGLAIVRQAAARLGGRVELGDGLAGRGCCFMLHLPPPARPR